MTVVPGEFIADLNMRSIKYISIVVSVNRSVHLEPIVIGSSPYFGSLLGDVDELVSDL